MFQSSEASASRLTTADGLKSSISEWVKSGKVVLVGVNDDGSMGEILSDEETTHIDLSILVKFDDSTGILLPADIPAEAVDPGSDPGSDGGLDGGPDDGPDGGPDDGPDGGPEPGPGGGPEPDPDEGDNEVEMTVTVSAKKLNSIGMAMSMNFDNATVKIEFKGNPKKGPGSNPVSALKDAINSAGGEIED